MKGPDALVEHLAKQLYHPRSDAHSNAICNGILADLLDQCPAIAKKAANGELVAKLNHTVTVNYQTWNIDLALGPPAGKPIPPAIGPIDFDTPATVQIAIEAKGVMTEHGKARQNRLRDLHAFQSHAHTYGSKVVAGGIVVVNVAPVFWSPTRSSDDITEHRSIERIGAETVDLFRNIPLRDEASAGAGLEAVCVLVVSHDNLRKNPDLPADAPTTTVTSLVTKPPAPQVGDPLHYSTFIQRLCRTFDERWI